MRRNVSLAGRIGSLLVLGAIASAGLLSRGEAADPVAAPTVPAAEIMSDGLGKILLGGAPRSVADLKAMQERVQKLTDRLQQCTVGVQVGQAWGSGVIVTKDGYVLTAAHVSGQPGRNVTFILSDGRELHGRTLGLNRTIDAGLMKITDMGEFPSVEMGISDTLKDGQWCLATGHPGGYQRDRKPVLRLGRVLLSDNSTITTDCTLVGGDSGGPLFDFDGKVIGINSRIAGPINANMHVPVNTFKETWDRMVKGDAWGHLPGNNPFIGIRGDAESKEAKISQIVPNSPASKSGLQIGDTIASVNGQDVPDFAAFKTIINDHQPGDELRLTIKRGDQNVDVKVKLAKQG